MRRGHAELAAFWERRAKEEAAEAERQRKRADGMTRWVDSWTMLVTSIGELILRVQERPQGRRFATVIDLRNVLAAHERECREKFGDA